MWGLPMKKWGSKGPITHELVFKDCRIPRDNVIGGMDQVGQGFKTAMRVLDKGRLSMGACALGASQKVMEICIACLKSRENAKPDQAVQFKLADMATRIYAARQMLHHAASLKDAGEKYDGPGLHGQGVLYGNGKHHCRGGHGYLWHVRRFH